MDSARASHEMLIKPIEEHHQKDPYIPSTGIKYIVKIKSNRFLHDISPYYVSS